MAEEAEAPPALPPRRRLSLIDVEGIGDVADGPDRALLRSRDFPEVGGDVGPSDVEVVLFDAYSIDSVVACWAARLALGDRVTFEGVHRAMTVDDLTVDVQNRVVAMIGVCWSLEAMQDFVPQCEWVFVVETYDSVALELEHVVYPTCVLVVDPAMCAASMAWNFFLPSEPVPALVRALEDAELGRSALGRSAEFARGYAAVLDLVPLFGAIVPGDQILSRLELLLDGGGRATRERCIEKGLALEAEERAACRGAVDALAVRVLRAFPAYLCAVAAAPSPHGGRAAEALVAELVARGVGEHRAVALALELRDGRWRIELRSQAGGANVAEIAATYGGFGRQARAFFTIAADEWEDLWIQPETVLWDVPSGSPQCLALRRGDQVTIAHRGERFPDAPADEWSWGHKAQEPLVEGWIPTLAHTLLLATRSEPEPGAGVRPLVEGDLLVAHGQRGQFVWGALLRGGNDTRGWYPRFEGLLQPVCPSSVRARLHSSM